MKLIKIFLAMLITAGLLISISCSDSDDVVGPVDEPVVINDLTVGLSNYSSIIINWTAPETALEYDIRYSTAVITDSNWAQAIQVENEPTPKAPGEIEILMVDNLVVATEYNFAIKCKIDSLQWSPLSNIADGVTLFFDIRGKIAYSSAVDGDNEIFIMDADGSNKQQLTFNFIGDSTPEWTPSGNSLVYVSKPNTVFQIFIIDIISGLSTNLSNSNYDEYEPNISPHDNKIAFNSKPTSYSRREVSVMNIDGSNKQVLTSCIDCGDYYPTWFPDSAKLIFTRNDVNQSPITGVYTLGVNDNSAELLVTDKFMYGFSWSPDGSKFVTYVDDDIFIYNADGTNPVNVTNGATSGHYPSWSPDGTKIAFAGLVDGDKEIFVMDIDGSNLIQLTDNDIDDSEPSWSPLP